MKPLFGIGLVVLVIGILSFFVPVPHSEHHGADLGDVHVGLTTHHEDKVPQGVSIVLLVVGAGMMIAGRNGRA